VVPDNLPSIQLNHQYFEAGKTPSPPPESLPSTPKTIRSLQQYAASLQLAVTTSDLSPTSTLRAQKYLKGSLAQAESGALALKRLENI